MEESITELSQKKINRAYYNAVVDGNAGAAQCWLERGADVNYRPHDAQYPDGLEPHPLFWTIPRCPEVAQVLIDYGVDVNATDGGQSMLIEALRAYAADIALMLIEAGADVTCTDVRGRTPLQVALEEPGLFHDVIAAIRRGL